MPTLLSDPSTGIYLVAAILAGVAGFVWLRARTRPTLIAFAVFALALALLALCDRLVDSPREAAVKSVRRIEAAANARDWDRAAAEVSEGFQFRGRTKPQFRAFLIDITRQYQVQFHFTAFDRDQVVYLPDGTVKMGFVGQVESPQLGGGRGATYIEAVYGRDPDGVWRARSAQAYDFIQRKTPQTIPGIN